MKDLEIMIEIIFVIFLRRLPLINEYYQIVIIEYGWGLWDDADKATTVRTGTAAGEGTVSGQLA